MGQQEPGRGGGAGRDTFWERRDELVAVLFTENKSFRDLPERTQREALDTPDIQEGMRQIRELNQKLRAAPGRSETLDLRAKIAVHGQLRAWFKALNDYVAECLAELRQGEPTSAAAPYASLTTRSGPPGQQQRSEAGPPSGRVPAGTGSGVAQQRGRGRR
jgi:hypothetical protein